MHCNWFSVCYELFLKAQIQWDAEGKPIYTKAEDGKLHITRAQRVYLCASGMHQPRITWCLQSVASSAQSQVPCVTNLVWLQKHDEEAFHMFFMDDSGAKVLYLTHWACPIIVSVCSWHT